MSEDFLTKLILTPELLTSGRKPVGEVEIVQRGDVSLFYCPRLADPLDAISIKASIGSSSVSSEINKGKVVASIGSQAAKDTISVVKTAADIDAEITIIMFSRPNVTDGSGDYFSINPNAFVSDRSGANKGFTYSQNGAVGGSPNPGSPRFTIAGVADYTAGKILNGALVQPHGIVARSGGSVRFFADHLFKQSISIGSFTVGEFVFTIGGQGPASAPAIKGFNHIEAILILNRAVTDSEYTRISRDIYQLLKPKSAQIIQFPSAGITAALSGTAADTIDESDLVPGGKTIILTLTNDTFVTGTSSEDGIAAGSDSDIAASGTNWDSLVKTDLDNTDVTISTTTVTNDTATITLPAYASYDNATQETITWTIPAASLTTSAVPVVATPTFTVDIVAGGASYDVVIDFNSKHTVVDIVSGLTLEAAFQLRNLQSIINSAAANTAADVSITAINRQQQSVTMSAQVEIDLAHKQKISDVTAGLTLEALVDLTGIYKTLEEAGIELIGIVSLSSIQKQVQTALVVAEASVGLSAVLKQEGISYLSTIVEVGLNHKQKFDDIVSGLSLEALADLKSIYKLTESAGTEVGALLGLSAKQTQTQSGQAISDALVTESFLQKVNNTTTSEISAFADLNIIQRTDVNIGLLFEAVLLLAQKNNLTIGDTRTVLADVSLNTIYNIDMIAGALADADVTLEQISTVSIIGAQLNIVTSDKRTIRITFTGRDIEVTGQNRTIILKKNDRNIH